MRKKLVVYLAGLLTVLGLGFGQAQFSDVPAGHWAQEAVERIAACGLITGFPDGTFRGNQNLTRYQAALIFQRLLNEIAQGGECVKPQASGNGLSDEDLTAIRNAIQELAAELAALGVRVSALEDNAASKDDIARLEAALEELKNMKPEGGLDEAALADLADRVEAASVAADTALAQAQALAERLDGVEGDVAALKTQVEADADSIRALNELAVLLNQDVLSLQDRVTALEKQLGDVDFESFANREDVSAIQEFATALRSDLVRLADRVSALDTRVSGLDSRLAAVEGTRPTLTGSLLARYGYRFTTGPGGDFDIDRLFPAAGFANDSDGTDLAGSSDTLGQADLTFGLKRTPGTGSGFNFSEASVTLRFSAGNGSLQVPANTISLRGVSVSGNVDGQPVSLRYSISNTFRFTPYFFNNNASAAGSGFVVSANLTKALLSPNFTIVLGSTAANAAAADRDYFGIRGAINLLGLNLGVNYAENDLRGTGADDRKAAVGVDWNGKLLGFLDLEGEFINSNDVITNTAGSLFYVQAGTSLGPISLRGNYRSINPGFATGNWTDALSGSSMGLSQDDTDRLFNPANAGAGFGLIASASLGIIGVNGYLDSRVPQLTLTPNTTAFGVGVTLGPIAGFNVTGYLNNASTASAAQYSVGNTYSNRGPATRAAFGTNLGVRVAHDGAASGALISGLNLAFEFRNSDGANAAFGSNGARTDLVGEARMALPLGFITITPNFRFHGYTAAATTPGTEVNYTTIKYGVQASTQPLFFGLSLNGAFAKRDTDFATGTDASETLIRVGLSLADFLLPGATLSVDAAQVTGTGVGGYTTREFNNPFTTTNDGLFNGPNGGFGPVAQATSDGGVRGIQVRYTYAGWGIWYGVFDFDSNGTDFSTIESVGRGFRVFYVLNF
ncbi:S-layer homology domain-containing protein [Meiothermus rufus]|uniref:S-layer homology domain-containing protein n=1 Tax=Meiothermus rufus TaxID=604332 RepID=UPI00040063A4|nr:S-layer homology domain-containing protein [Meiothermus rufus]